MFKKVDLFSKNVSITNKTTTVTKTKNGKKLFTSSFKTNANK
ncbi:hypothetical protein JOC54_000414 [Alkalihalobacillus xiaoxiensis]|uniref:Uncharacterized protein n=1 Tax=Shouchella xiaoxiensis TaxID=766895 RepID=A0ABS2SNS8_9BACI|nr:hypothetical protein [Shouchella xiaoxiensis]MBM7837183.1 hypothetical protein [Shouchella xiaoxiensis]